MKRGIYLLRQDVQHLKGDYLVAAVVVASTDAQALMLVREAIKLGGYRGVDGVWNAISLDDERPICEPARMTQQYLGTAGDGHPSAIVLMTFGQDYDA